MVSDIQVLVASPVYVFLVVVLPVSFSKWAHPLIYHSSIGWARPLGGHTIGDR